MTFSQSYQYLRAFDRFFKDIRILHFIGLQKPWMFGGYDKFKEYWWSAFNKHYSPDVVQYVLQTTGSGSNKGEASALNIEPSPNVWDIESVDNDQSSNIARQEHTPSIFPWEEKKGKCPTHKSIYFVLDSPAKI